MWWCGWKADKDRTVVRDKGSIMKIFGKAGTGKKYTERPGAYGVKKQSLCRINLLHHPLCLARGTPPVGKHGKPKFLEKRKNGAEVLSNLFAQFVA